MFQGFYEDPDTGERVDDECYQYILAVPRSKLGEMRSLLADACFFFEQKYIYLSVKGNVEFIGREL